MPELTAPLMVAVMGPTASGKTALAEAIADDLDAELINADAFQVYRGMDIGTAKPANRQRYRLLDLKDPDETYGVGEFCMLAQAHLGDLWDQGRSAVFVGGTGLYIRALFEEYSGLQPGPNPVLRAELNLRHARDGIQSLIDELLQHDPLAHERLDTKNPVRVKRALERALRPQTVLKVSLPPFRRIKLAISVESDSLASRIESRTQSMVQNGWVRRLVLC